MLNPAKPKLRYQLVFEGSWPTSVAFLGSGLLARLTVTLWKVETPNGQMSVQGLIYRSVFAPMLEPRIASLGYAVTFVLLWFVILWALWRRRIFLKV